MPAIALTKGLSAIVDDCDYEWLTAHNWCALMSRKPYAARGVLVNQKAQMLLMHREIIGAQRGQSVDHINGNTLDNRRENLRVCSNTQNQQNRNSLDKTSKYKGVSWSKGKKSWRVDICVDGKGFWLGNYRDEVDAALAYDTAARCNFGEFARVNFPLGEEPCCLPVSAPPVIAGRSFPRKRSGTSSQYLGVSWSTKAGLWFVQVGGNGGQRCVGRFASELDAALAYDEAVLKLRGGCARLNFPQGQNNG